MSADPGPAESAGDVERLRRLVDVSRALSGTTSLAEVARVAAERGAALLDGTAAVLMLSDAEGALHVRAASGVELERVARFGDPSAGELEERLEGLLATSEVSFIAVPLVAGGAVIGLVAVALRQAATSADEWLLSALADQAAAALEHARIGGEVRLDLEDRLAMANRLRVSERATDAKDRALSTLAHDIRTPLGAIDGYCANLEDELYGVVNDRQRQALRRVRMSGRHLLSLLDNVMEMARLNAGVVHVRAEPVRLADVARESVVMLGPASDAKRQSLQCVGLEDVVVTGDADRLRQVLVNLLGNAVKFTPAGGAITVDTSAPVIGGVAWGEVRVTDTGPGISDAERTAVFEPYYRSEGTALVPGVGLGLAISQTLVERMGGELTLVSEVGTGSAFSVRLMLADRDALAARG